jgi:hypothetical protein
MAEVISCNALNVTSNISNWTGYWLSSNCSSNSTAIALSPNGVLAIVWYCDQTGLQLSGVPLAVGCIVYANGSNAVYLMSSDKMQHYGKDTSITAFIVTSFS